MLSMCCTCTSAKTNTDTDYCMVQVILHTEYQLICAMNRVLPAGSCESVRCVDVDDQCRCVRKRRPMFVLMLKCSADAVVVLSVILIALVPALILYLYNSQPRVSSVPLSLSGEHTRLGQRLTPSPHLYYTMLHHSMI